MSERQWGIRDPNIEPKTCKYCGEQFYPDTPNRVYCEHHRDSKYAERVHRGISETRTIVCRGCKTQFTVTTGMGVGARRFCDSCKETRKKEAAVVGGSAIRLASAKGSRDLETALFVPLLNIARMPNSWDEEYAQIEWMFEDDQKAIMRDLETRSVVYGASVTEHHQHPFTFERLIFAVENVSDKNRQKETHWAHERLRELGWGNVYAKTVDENDSFTEASAVEAGSRWMQESVQDVWADPPKSEKEQWVINLMVRFERIE